MFALLGRSGLLVLMAEKAFWGLVWQGWAHRCRSKAYFLTFVMRFGLKATVTRSECAPCIVDGDRFRIGFLTPLDRGARLKVDGRCVATPHLGVAVG